MFYCVEDSDGDIAFHTTDPDDYNKTLYSIHSTLEGAMSKLSIFPTATIKKA